MSDRRIRGPRRASARRPVLDALERRTLLTTPGMTLTLASHTVAANAGAAATTGTVTLTGGASALPVTVNLASSIPGAASVASSVVIPAGQASATFNVDAPTGDTSQGNQSVTISGSAAVDTPLARDSGFATSSPAFIATAVAIQPDGKVVTVGDEYTGNSQAPYDFAVTRDNADGSADATFNGGSTAITAVSGESIKAQAVAISPDGKIVVGGVFQVSGGSQYNFILARYNADGSLDTTFGTGGLVTLTPTSGSYNEIWALAVQPDGKILAGGDVDDGDPTYDDFAVARFNADGSLDTGFGTGGIASTSFSAGADRGFGLALQPDGGVVVAGTAYEGNATSHVAVARFTASGQPDATFGTGGTAVTNVPGDFEEAKGVALQPDGKIVVAGYVDNAGVYPPTANNVALVRYNGDGTLDTGFGTGGIAVQDFGGDDRADAVAVQPDGMIVVAGQGGASGAPLVARFLPNGTLESSVTTSDVGYQALALAPGGRVVVAGASAKVPNSGVVTAFAGAAAVTASDTLTVIGIGVPTATNDSYSVTKATPLVVAAPGVLANDTVANGLTLTAVKVAGPSHGTLTLNSDGSFTYTPTGAYLGPDSFTYQAVDGSYTSNTATVSLNVTGTDDPPVSGNDSYTLYDPTRVQSSLTVAAASGVLANDSDPNGQPITAVLVAGPSHGTLTLNANGSFVYTVAANYTGTDSFTYQASDGTLLGNVATVTIRVTANPVAVADTYTTPENTPLTVAAPGILANDTDPNGLTLHPVVTSYPADGTLTVNSDGSFTYTPKANFHGTDTFNYYVSDGSYSSTYVTDTINVPFVDQPPVSAGDSYSVVQGGTLTAGAGVTALTMSSEAGDYIGQGQSYSYTPSSGPFSVTNNANDSVISFSFHTPSYSHFWYVDLAAPNGATLTPGIYTGATRYPYQASTAPGLDVSGDGRGSNTSTGQFTVLQAVYGADGSVLAFAATFEQHSEGATPALTGEVLYNSSGYAPEGVLFNDTPAAPSETLSAKLVSGPSDGQLALNPDGSFTYTPNPGYVGPDSFTYKANDGTLDGNVATVALNVYPTPPNTPTVTWAPPADITYGTPLGAAQFNLSASVPGTFAYAPLPSTVLQPGSGQTLTATFTPTDFLDYAAVTATTTVNVLKVTPTITWPGPASITYGTSLSSAQLDATSSVPGTFVYSPAAGTRLNGGAGQALSVTFTPTDSAHYATVTATNTINVLKVTPTITWSPASFTYGPPLDSTELNATSSVPGTFAYAPTAGTVVGAGANQALTATFTPTDTTDYNTITVTRNITVSKASPVITYGVLASYPYGTVLSPALLNMQSNVPGTFTSSPASGTVLGAGLGQVVTWTFTPTDSADYNTRTLSTTLNIVKATPTVAWTAPADITYPTPLGASQLDATASVPGTFAYSPASGTVPGAGAGQTLSVTFTPTDSADYNAVTTTTKINVAKATPTLSWAAPADITYGTPLGASQLDAIASVPGTFAYSIATGTVLGAGLGQALSVTFTPTDPADYNAVTATTKINVFQATPTLSWAAPADITYGTALDATQLDATASVPGQFAYTPAAGTVLHAGAGQTLSVTFTPTDSADYATATATTKINVAKAASVLTWPSPASIIYGTPLGASQLDATASVPGTITYSPAAGTVLHAGNGQTLSATFTPADSADYAGAQATTTINVAKAIPTITWASPASIAYGTPLGASQLDAVATSGGVPVAGTFTYTPPAGTHLTPGANQVLSASFQPSDAADFSSVVGSTKITVVPATPAFDSLTQATAVYGSASTVFSGHLAAGTTVPTGGVTITLGGTSVSAAIDPSTGRFSASVPTGSLTASSTPYTVFYTYAASADFNGATATSGLTVTKAAQTISWSAPAAIVYGTPLSAAQLDATASAAGPDPTRGALTYSPASGTVLHAGNGQALTVTAAATADYLSASKTVAINVSKATPTITWPGPASIVYGTPLGSTQLDASATFQGKAVAGHFTYASPSGTVLGAGAGQTLKVTFTPDDSTDFNAANASTTITVLKATPTVTWAAPASIVYGTALGSAQLDAKASVPGTFAYTPAAGTVLHAGSGQVLTATFTPTDAKDQNVVTATTKITVLKATPTITWATPASIVYGTALGTSQLDAKASVAGTFKYTPAAGTILQAGSQTLSAAFTPTDTVDYNTATATTKISVAKATPTITWATPASIVYGTALGSSQLDAKASVAGTLTYSPAAGKILGAGSQTLSATFTPTDTIDYNTTTATAKITVTKATPTITWAAPTSIVYGTALGTSQLDAKASVAGTFKYTPAAGTVLGAGSQTLSATFTPTDTADYNTATAHTTLSVTKAHLLVTAMNQDMGHGAAVPALTAVLSGFVNGDTAKVVSGSAALATTASNAKGAGTYPITTAVGTLSAANYDFTPANGTVTIHPEVLDVRAVWGTRSMSLLGLGRDLPFVDITGIEVTFSDDVTVASGDLSLKSTTGAGTSYKFSGFSYSAAAREATWTLPTALGVDELMLALDSKFGARANPAIAVWNTNPVKFNVLPGDFDGNGSVLAQDATGIQAQIIAPTVWADLDGNGVVDQNDVTAARNRNGTRLP